VFSLTLFNPVGCALRFSCCLQQFCMFSCEKNSTAYLLQYPVSILRSFCRRPYSLVIAMLPASIRCKREEQTTCPGGSRPKHHFSKETWTWCFEGTWEQKSESLSVQTPPSYDFRPFNLTGTRYAATSPRCPAYLLANSLCALALLHHVLFTDPKKPHQHGRRMPTERSMPPYKLEPQFLSYESPIEVARSQTTLCYPWKSLCVPQTRIQSTLPSTTPAAGHPRRRPRPPLTTPPATSRLSHRQPAHSNNGQPQAQRPFSPLDDRPP